MLRRSFVVGAILTAACKKESRCKHCGMRIDPSSPWRSELVAENGTVTSFDTPRCAFTSWRRGATPAKTLRAQDYYERRWAGAEELRFVVGGDVLGPMGPDLVPVERGRAMKFVQDHGADRAYAADEVTLALLDAMTTQ
jgi:copper chaperone NosL